MRDAPLSGKREEITNITPTIKGEGLVDMRNKTISTLILLFCLLGSASSQGYMGTVSTGTGIIPAITVGRSTSSAASVGAVSSLENFSGSWSLDLKGSENRHVELQVYQENDLILGSGKMSTGQALQAVTAAGSATDGEVSIFISVIDSHQAFRIRLTPSGSSLAGEYDSLIADGTEESGTATGQMALVASSGQATAVGKSSSPSAGRSAYVGSATKSATNTTIVKESKSIFKSSHGEGVTTYQ